MDIIAHDAPGMQIVWVGIGDSAVRRGGGEKQWPVDFYRPRYPLGCWLVTSGEGETKFFNKARVRGCGNKISIVRDLYRRTDGITI